MFKGEERIFHLRLLPFPIEVEESFYLYISSFVKKIFSNNLSLEPWISSWFSVWNHSKTIFWNRIWYAQVYPLILLCAVQEMRSIYNDRYKRRALATHTNNIYFRSRMVGNAVRDRFLCNKHMIYRMGKLISQL